MKYTVFKTNTNKYLYDREDNRIIPISSHLYKVLKISGKSDDIRGDKEIQKLKDKGICRENITETIEHPFSKNVDYYLDTKMEQIILQVTQNCNLRCDYCTYSGKYNNRKHSSKKMSFELATRAIDFFMEKSRNSRESTVGFYGGEPLLEFSLIKKIVGYIEKNYEGKKIYYSMTTNGTLLNKETMEYLKEKEFNLMISLDGNQEVHDKSRRFANGKGSFAVIMENLQYMKEHYPDFYYKCRTNTVLAPETEFRCVQEFLVSDTLVDSLNKRMNLISDIGMDKGYEYSETVLIEKRKEEFKNLLVLLEEIEGGLESSFFGDYINELRRHNKILKLGKLNLKKGHPGGPCIPGGKRPFVDIKGNIFPCEKVNETNEMLIGSLEEGFNHEKILDMLNIARTTEEQCKNCWAFMFCGLCIAASIGVNGVSSDKRLAKCTGVKESAREILRTLAILRENGFDIENQL